MKTYYINNRQEFGATIKAKNAEEALKIFLTGKCQYELLGELWQEYITIEDENGMIIKDNINEK
jgi:hypothetical protein